MKKWEELTSEERDIYIDNMGKVFRDDIYYSTRKWSDKLRKTEIIGYDLISKDKIVLASISKEIYDLHSSIEINK